MTSEEWKNKIDGTAQDEQYFQANAEALLRLIMADIENNPTVKQWNENAHSRMKISIDWSVNAPNR